MKTLKSLRPFAQSKKSLSQLIKPIILGTLCSILFGSDHGAMAGGPVGFDSHQTYISALTRNADFDIEDSAAVLKYVLSQSNDEIHVQPTENYSYFKFTYGGLHWQGNMRLETENGVAEKLHFAYFVVPAPWHDEDLGQYKAFGEKDGLKIKLAADQTYKIQFGSLSRTFVLNDISTSNIPSNLLGPDQTYLGLAHDESGLRFYLLFDKSVGDFAYILDEQKQVADKLVPLTPEQDKLVVGIRTGFVFKSESEFSRKRLVGVYSDNISNNNYYDGPFDQLPDGYRGKMSIKEAFAQIDPEFSKTIDEFGNFVDREGARVVIAPYIRYSSPTDFDSMKECSAYHATSVDYRVCMKDFLER